jgi:hypothetical protein
MRMRMGKIFRGITHLCSNIKDFLCNSFDFVCYIISYLMVKSVLKKSPPFKSYSKNSEWPSKKFLIKMSIFVLQRYLCYDFWAMCYKVVLMCYNRNPYFVVFTH